MSKLYVLMKIVINAYIRNSNLEHRKRNVLWKNPS